jgi:hypothetical protein
VLDHLLDIGCGAVIYGGAASRWNEPEWVFRYGDLLSYSICGGFDGPQRETADNPEASTGGNSTVLDHDQEVLVGAPISRRGRVARWAVTYARCTGIQIRACCW